MPARGSDLLGLFGGFPFDLSENERRELAELDSGVARLQQQKISKLRELARKKRIAAERLEDLKSECGRPFVEQKGYGYKIAAAASKAKPFSQELAYLCISEYETRRGKDTCGWVKGEPKSEKYDNLGPLCGSAGTRYYCRICGKLLWECQSVVSEF